MLPVKDSSCYVTFGFVGVKAKTEKACLVVLENGDERWLPKSQVVAQYGDGVNHFVVVPYFVADSMGLTATTWSGHPVHSITKRTGKELKDYMAKHGVNL